MSSDEQLIAARYVQALFELATQGQSHDQVKADMLTLKSTLHTSSDFRKLLANPVLSRDASEKAMTGILGTLKASDLTHKFFALLARNRRLSLTGLIIDSYLSRLAENRGELSVKVTSAQKLSEEEIKALSASIGKSTGKKVEIETQENPALIGGLQLRVGSRLLDNSVASKLSRLKQVLTAV